MFEAERAVAVPARGERRLLIHPTAVDRAYALYHRVPAPVNRWGDDRIRFSSGAPIGRRVEDRHDLRMVERGDRLGFVVEPPQLVVAGQRR